MYLKKKHLPSGRKEKNRCWADLFPRAIYYLSLAAVLRNQSRRFFAFAQTYDDLQGHGSRLEVILPCPSLWSSFRSRRSWQVRSQP